MLDGVPRVKFGRVRDATALEKWQLSGWLPIMRVDYGNIWANGIERNGKQAPYDAYICNDCKRSITRKCKMQSKYMIHSLGIVFEARRTLELSAWCFKRLPATISRLSTQNKCLFSPDLLYAEHACNAFLSRSIRKCGM